jgi:dipeptidyl aminopeptidase/acylaminoacyl peptidase
VRTPLLILVGEKDSMNAFESEELFADLKDLEQRVVLVKYPDEGHVPFEWSSADQIDYFNRMIDWFDKHLREIKDRSRAGSA